MTKAIKASLALLLAFFVTACGPASEKKLLENGGVTVEEALHAADATADIDKAEQEFASIKAHRHTSEGWAAEVRPGDTRGAHEISTDLAMMNLVTERLDKLGNSDRAANLEAEIRETMIEDLRLLLKVADHDLDINAIGTFLEYAPKLDTSLEEDFGTNAKDLRAKALIMARKEMTELRPRIREGSADAIGVVSSILQEWQFTPDELELTATDMKSVSMQ